MYTLDTISQCLRTVGTSMTHMSVNEWRCKNSNNTKGAITRPNFYMKHKRKTAFHKLFSEHLVLHNLLSFEFSLQFMKLGLVV